MDVSGDTNLEGLVALFDVESPDEVLRADGEEQLVFMFDLRQEPLIESVEVEALLGNDYRVEVSFLMNENTRARNHAHALQRQLLPDGSARSRECAGWVKPQAAGVLR